MDHDHPKAHGEQEPIDNNVVEQGDASTPPLRHPHDREEGGHSHQPPHAGPSLRHPHDREEGGHFHQPPYPPRDHHIPRHAPYGGPMHHHYGRAPRDRHHHGRHHPYTFSRGAAGMTSSYFVQSPPHMPHFPESGYGSDPNRMIVPPDYHDNSDRRLVPYDGNATRAGRQGRDFDMVRGHTTTLERALERERERG